MQLATQRNLEQRSALESADGATPSQGWPPLLEAPAPLDDDTAALFQGFIDALDHQMAETRHGMAQLLDYHEQKFGAPLFG